MKVLHDLFHPWAAGKAVCITGPDPGDEPDAGLACRLPVIRRVADEERLAGRRTGLKKDLADTLGLCLR